MDLNVQFFDPSSMKDNSITLLLGARGTGKSTLSQTFMSYKTHLPEGICISPTDEMTGFWRQHIPPLYIHHDYTADTLDDFLDHQHAKWLDYKRECKRKGVPCEEGKVEPAFVILDDVTYDKNFFRKKSARRLFMNGRHYNVFVLVTCQYLVDLEPGLRNQIDYVVMLNETSPDTIEKLYQYFAKRIFPTFRSFTQTLESCTENREALVLNKRAHPKDLEEAVQFFRASPGMKYMLGSPTYWAVSDEVYVSDDEEHETERAKKRFFDSGLSKKQKDTKAALTLTKVYPAEGRKSRDDYKAFYEHHTITDQEEHYPGKGKKSKRLGKRKKKEKIDPIGDSDDEVDFF